MAGFISILAIAVCSFSVVQGQSDQAVRDIISEDFVKARPARAAASPGSARRARYRPAAAKSTTSAGATASSSSSALQLGLTIWRLRPSNPQDHGGRIVVHHDDETEEWTPERVESTTLLQMGERIRFSFESPQEGYLYVIDREQYVNGSTGDPYLIFPTARTRNGDNRVSPGRIIEIPSQEDRPTFFTLRRSRPDQTGEWLTVIVTPQPIDGLAIGPKPLLLSSQQAAEWEKQWGGAAEKFEMTDGAGKPWTKAEQEAGANATRQLSLEDPGPQTIYRIAAKPGAPFLVNIGLRYGRAGSRPKPRR